MKLFGELEAAVMNLLWKEEDRMTVRDVHARLARQGTDVAYTTAMTVMSRLAAKGLLARTMNEGTYVYRATETRCGYFSTLSTRMVATIRRDFGPEAAQTFVTQISRHMKSLFVAALVSLTFFAGVQTWAATLPGGGICRALSLCAESRTPQMSPAAQLSILPQSLP